MEQNEKIIRLIKNKKKGIFHLIFSRLFFMIILIAFQLLLFVSIYDIIRENIPFFPILQTIFFLVMIFYLFRCDMDSTAKLTWLAIIVLFPIPGSIFLWYTRNSIGHKANKNRIEYLINETKNKLVQS